MEVATSILIGTAPSLYSFTSNTSIILFNELVTDHGFGQLWPETRPIQSYSNTDTWQVV